MNNDNFWAEEEEEFRDIPDEVVEGQQAPPAPVKEPARQAAPRPQAPIQEKTILQSYEENPKLDVSDDEDYDVEADNDASLRIERGQLYRMLMSHNIFEGVEGDPKAAKYVQKEIRQFAKERMEIMLGMRKETTTVERLEIDFPFNETEVQVLKQLAYTATKGESLHSDKYVPEVRKVTEEIDNIPAKRPGLNPIVKKSAPAPKPLPTRPAAPIKRMRNDATIDQILAEEGVSKRELDTTFDPNYRPLEKPIHEMTEDELRARNKEIAKRTAPKQIKSESALPMPTLAQEEMMYTQRANQAAAHPQMQTIMGLLLNNQKKQ